MRPLGGRCADPAPPAPKAAEAEAAAATAAEQLSMQAMPIRQYLEASVVPLLLQGMQALVKERPDKPVEYLAAFLLKNDPQRRAPSGGRE